MPNDRPDVSGGALTTEADMAFFLHSLRSCLRVVVRSHQAVYTDDLLNLAASLEAENGAPTGERQKETL